MTTLNTILGFDSSDRAKFRFHVLQVFYQGGFKAIKIAFPELKRATLYRWKKKYEDSSKKLNSLIPSSTKPHHTRIAVTPLGVVSLVKQLRKDYPRMGKAKIKRFVDQFCLVEGSKLVSESSIGRVIKRNKLFFAGKAKGRRMRQDKAKRQRIRLCPNMKDQLPGYIQLDGVKFHYLSRYYYFLTAVDIVSKQAWVELVPSTNSRHTTNFLKTILQTAWYKIHIIQTDNGSEFKLFFEEAAKQAGLTHLFSYPRHPKTNGFVERFNWTIQDEFIFDSEDFLLFPNDFKIKLNIWLVWYNQIRPHQSLEYLSPYQNLEERRLSQK